MLSCKGTRQDHQCWKEHLAWNPSLGDIPSTATSKRHQVPREAVLFATQGPAAAVQPQWCCSSSREDIAAQVPRGVEEMMEQQKGWTSVPSSCSCVMLVSPVHCSSEGPAVPAAAFAMVKLCPCSPWGGRVLPELPSEAATEKNFGQRCASGTS